MEAQIEHRNVLIWRYLQLLDLRHNGERADQSEAIEAEIDKAISLIMRLDLGLPRVERLDPYDLGFENIPLETIEAHAQPPHEKPEGSERFLDKAHEDIYALDRELLRTDPVAHVTSVRRTVHPTAMIEQLQSSGIFEHDVERRDEHGSGSQGNHIHTIRMEYVDPHQDDDEESDDETDDPDFEDEYPEWENHEDWGEEEED